MTKCKCGSQTFRVTQTTIFVANINEKKLCLGEELSRSIDIIECSICEKEYSHSDFFNIEQGAN